jgi:nucleotide-binding universal stress UspA family protein
LYNALHDVKPKDDDVRFSHQLAEGKPASAILKLAAEVNAEMIVMGTHGRSGITRMVMGSVAEEVVRKSQCPVLTLRNPVESYEKEPVGIA